MKRTSGNAEQLREEKRRLTLGVEIALSAGLEEETASDCAEWNSERHECEVPVPVTANFSSGPVESTTACPNVCCCFRRRVESSSELFRVALPYWNKP